MCNSNFGRLYTKSQMPKAVFDKEEKIHLKNTSLVFSVSTLMVIILTVSNQIAIL